MSVPQGLIFTTLLLTLVLFVTGRWRYDVVALLALLIVTLTRASAGDTGFCRFQQPGGDHGGGRARAQPRVATFGGC